MTGTATQPIVELDDVHKVYPMGDSEVHALRGVNLAVQRGDFWAIMGASGSGKSTLLNILGCLDRPTSGHYRLDGRDVSRMDDDALSAIRLQHLGFIFQSFNLIPQLTVLRNIELPLFYLGWDTRRSRTRAAELAERVGLGDRLNHRPAELSGGQQQRVAIARALTNDPDVLLADEPTGNLDTPTSEQILRILEELNGQGKTIILITHENDIAARARRRIVMRDGRVEHSAGGG